VRFLGRNSPHRPTASEPGKSATQAEVDGDYFCYRLLPLPERGVDLATCPLFVLHPHTAGQQSHSQLADRSRERTR
jgi:hypothetical protein